MSRERELLRELVARYSPTGEEAAVASYLVQRFQDAGLEACCDKAGNFVGRVGDGPVEVALVGHIDTVPGEIAVEERDARLYGRGAVDAKGPMAAFASAALRLSGEGGPAGPPLRNVRLLVVGAVGEEGGSPGARYLVGRHSPEYLVIGEPSGWDSVVLGYKGSLRLSYELVRTSRHSAGPDESAPEVALAYWLRLKHWCGAQNEGKRVFDQISPSLRAINTQSDGFHDRVTMDIGVRLPLGVVPAELEAQLREWAGEARLEVWFGDPAVRGEKNTPLVRAFLSGLRDAGAQPRFKVKTGTSDMNVLGPVWNCPVLAYGPGDSTLDHTPEEHIILEEYDRAVDILEGALRHLDESVKR